MKTIGVSLARAWKYHKLTVPQPMKLGQIYFFSSGSAYFHDPNQAVRLSYKHKDFLLQRNNQKILFSIYPRTLTNKRVIEWIRTWADEGDIVITPGGISITINRIEKTTLQQKKSNKEYVYFILNDDSNAVKIGRAKNVRRRQISLQIANPVRLILLKTIELDSAKQAKEKEASLHSQFWHLRVRGEWFKHDPELQDFINTLL